MERPTRYSTSRQKACHQCAAAKAKCDRTPGKCTRCEQRGLPCAYAQPQPSPQPDVTGANDAESRESARNHLPSPEHDGPPIESAVYPEAELTFPDAEAGQFPPQPPPTRPGAELDFSNLELTCPINPDDIANRWLHSFVPLPGQSVKRYPPSISAFIHRVLQSYANRSIRGHHIPPFIHWSQLTILPSSRPLATCLSVIRMCEKPPPGSENAVAEALQHEMTKLYEGRSALDDMTLLSAYQAYLIYAMTIFFRLGRGCDAFLRQAMVDAQELACETARRGLACVAEREASRPRWEAWIVAETKRRTVFAMCMFDSALLTRDRLATHLATELRGLLAPANKSLWEARDRRDWEAGYDLQLAAWDDAGLRIEELWPVPEDYGEAEVQRRRERVDLWLEDLDDFRTMVYAVTSCTHGG